MTEHPDDLDPRGLDAIGRALGRIPSGLFIVTTRDDRGRPLGFLGSFVQQMAIQPPTVAVAIAKERDHLDAVRATGRFAVSVLGEDHKHLMKPFFKGPGEGSPFDDVAHRSSEGAGGAAGPPVLDEALAWVECRVAGEHNAGDHVVVFGVVEAGSGAAGAPLVHTRKNGLRYA